MSLGVDLMPHKTCTLDCVYCECGKTTHLTLARKPYVAVDRLQQELASFLEEAPEIDFITFSGAGEPTLHSSIGQIARFVKRRYPRYPLALLTNGTLFHEPEVRAQVADIDLVIVSVDAASASVFRRVNRPHPGLDLAAVIKGLVALRREHPGRIWAEVFLVAGVNDREEEARCLADLLERIQPDRIQLNTLDRPGTEPWVQPLDAEAMARVAACIPKARWTGAPTVPLAPSEQEEGLLLPRLLAAIRRRPSTVADMAAMLGVSEAKIRPLLDTLLTNGEVAAQTMARGIFYTAQNRSSR
jgi:wyosine [tRNA(Phe)-imidazoG37] synthetase (radical SAM superfamily)